MAVLLLLLVLPSWLSGAWLSPPEPWSCVTLGFAVLLSLAVHRAWRMPAHPDLRLESALVWAVVLMRATALMVPPMMAFLVCARSEPRNLTIYLIAVGYAWIGVWRLTRHPALGINRAA